MDRREVLRHEPIRCLPVWQKLQQRRLFHGLPEYKPARRHDVLVPRLQILRQGALGDTAVRHAIEGGIR